VNLIVSTNIFRAQSVNLGIASELQLFLVKCENILVHLSLGIQCMWSLRLEKRGQYFFGDGLWKFFVTVNTVISIILFLYFTNSGEYLAQILRRCLAITVL